MRYSLSNIYTKYCCNQTTTVKIIIDGWVVYFFETHCVVCLPLSEYNENQ